jgi:lysophospholipase L1-like esterase
MYKNKYLIIILVLLVSVIASVVIILSNDTEISKWNISNMPLKESEIVTKAIIPNKHLNIVAIGDSLTEGVGDTSNRGGYLYYLEQALISQPNIDNLLIDNLGVKGRRSDQLITKLESEKMLEPIKNADIVLITIGGNDLMQIVKENFTGLTKPLFDKKVDGFTQNIHEIFSIIEDNNEDAKIYLVGMYNPFSAWFPELNELEEIIEEFNLEALKVAIQYKNGYFIPINDIFATNLQTLLADDNFHPNDDGYQLMAKRIVDYLGYEYQYLEFYDQEYIIVDPSKLENESDYKQDLKETFYLP